MDTEAFEGWAEGALAQGGEAGIIRALIGVGEAVLEVGREVHGLAMETHLLRLAIEAQHTATRVG